MQEVNTTEAPSQEEDLVVDLTPKEVIEAYLNDPKVKDNLIQLALSLYKASNGKWVTPQEVHKKSEYRGDLTEFKQMIDLLIMSKLAFSKIEKGGFLKIKITLNKDARKATLVQQISQMEQTLIILKDELDFILEVEKEEAQEALKK